jgi:hypothetical protein
MATEKVSLTLSQKAVREARRKAGKRGLSAYVDDALKLKLQHERIDAWLADAERTHGPIPQDVQRKVDREWAEADARRSRRRRSSSTRER